MAEHNPLNSFRRIAVNTFSDLQHRVAAITGSRRGYVFRGQATAGEATCGVAESAELRTGLERTCADIDGDLDIAPIRENAIIREFLRRAHHYLPDTPGHEQKLEWLALMQHHGAPTRLLDWTYSLHVAAHFAFSHATRMSDSNAAIWMINSGWCLNASATLRQKLGKPQPILSIRPIESSDENLIVDALFFDDGAPGVWPVNPFRLNQRLTIQKGVFLCPDDAGQPFEANLSALDGAQSEENVVQFVVPRELMPDIGLALYDANVTEATLFPDLDGFARSLTTSVRYLRLDRLEPRWPDRS